MAEQTDEELVTLVLGGEKEVYGILVQRYHRQIFNLMYRYSHTDADAADLTQDVFLRVFKRLITYRFEGRFFSWLYSIAVHIASDWARQQTLRREKHHLFVTSQTIDNGDVLVPEQIQQREESAHLEHALMQLSDRTREILFLRFKEECPIREIAYIFSCSESAAKMRISRGIQELRKLYRKLDD